LPPSGAACAAAAAGIATAAAATIETSHFLINLEISSTQHGAFCRSSDSPQNLLFGSLID
jgi:hypothetical protein